MAIRDLIEQIAAGWKTYRQKVRVDKNDPVYGLVVEELPRALLSHVTAFETITPEGSTGIGNITAAPWVALFDRRLTTSATTGYYVVYLFSIDMSAVTLSLAFGTTQFREQFGSPQNAFPRMRFAATRLQEMFNHLIPANIERGPIDLAAEPRHGLHYSYQQASILSYPPYRIGDLPEELQLVNDLKMLVRLYTDIVSDPLEPTVERLVEAVVEPAAQVRTIDVRDFEPRPPQKGHALSDYGNHGRRYSPESRKVGDAGERIVRDYERDRLIKLGRQDLAGRVRWHGPEAEYFGWDITSFDDDGNEIFIEVKSSVGKTVSNVNLTVNEWNAARDAARRDHYYIYIVTDALSAAPQIERLRNPASYIDTKQLDCEPILYELQLQQRSGLLTGSDAPTIVRVEAFGVDASGMQQLDLEFLGNQAKAIALEVAADSQLYLAPEALAAIDKMIAERKDVIQQTWRDLETWKAHVRHISIVTAKMYKSRNVKSIKDPNELIETARGVYRVYPYD